MSDSSDSHRERLKYYRKTANQMASMHSIESDYYSTLHLWLNGGGVVFSAFLLTLAMVDDGLVQASFGIESETLKWIMAALAFFNFSITLILLTLRPGSQASAHREAVEHYARAKRAIDHLQEEENISALETNRFQEEYWNTQNLPKIKDRRFLRLKQAHLIKMAVSNALEQSPHDSISQIKKNLASKK